MKFEVVVIKDLFIPIKSNYSNSRKLFQIKCFLVLLNITLMIIIFFRKNIVNTVFTDEKDYYLI